MGPALQTYLTPQDWPALRVLRQFRPHNETLGDFMASRCEADPDRVFMSFGSRTWTWAQTREVSEQLAASLADKGVAPGARVMVSGLNSEWHVLLLLAAARLGAVFVPVNPQFKAQELAYVLGHARPALLVCDAGVMPVAEQAMDFGTVRPALAALDESLLSGGAASIESPVSDPDTPCLIIYTSGTTGFPKGVVHSQRSLVLAGEAFVERLRLQRTERMLLILPMFHINALFYSVAGAMAAGAVLLIEQRFSASAFWQRVAQLNATQVNVIEAIVAILMSRPEAEYVAGHGLRKVYGVRQGSVEAFRRRFGVPILVGGYAMTEIPGVLSTPFDRPMRPNSMGVICRHPDPSRQWAECRVVDEQGNALAPGQVGELTVRTPIVMRGYFNDAEQTQASFRDGWFLTGDLVSADEDGFYYFVSRKKDIIRRRGENIAGQELDRVVAEHPDVLIAAAIGVPSPFGDEDILLAVTPKEGASVTPADIVQWCRSRLADIKVPRYVVFIDNMPLTPTHKVAKAQLKKDTGLLGRAVDFSRL